MGFWSSVASIVTGRDDIATNSGSSGDSSGKSAKLSFGKEHIGRSSGKLETDSYRSVSDSGKTEKTGHWECEPSKVDINRH